MSSCMYTRQTTEILSRVAVVFHKDSANRLTIALEPKTRTRFRQGNYKYNANI